LTKSQHETNPLPEWAHKAVTVVAEPPFVPRAVQPATIIGGLLDWIVPSILNAVLKRVDLTALVLEKVSVPEIVDSIDLNTIAARIDIEAIIARIDLSGIAKQVIDEIDLGGIIRDSSGALASESVVGVRLQSASADDAVERVIARFLPGRRRNDRVAHRVEPSAGNGVNKGVESSADDGVEQGVVLSAGDGVDQSAPSGDGG
jgi:hypothetical protein